MFQSPQIIQAIDHYIVPPALGNQAGDARRDRIGDGRRARMTEKDAFNMKS